MEKGKFDKTYNEIINAIRKVGFEYIDESRQVKCIGLPSLTVMYSLRGGELPILTTKKMYIKGIVGELLWFLQGKSNIKPLVDNDINIWNKDAYNWYLQRFQQEKADGVAGPDDAPMPMEMFIEQVKSGESLGNVGRNYGVQWRHWKDNDSNLVVDQITNLVHNMIHKPMSRRHIVTAWNPADIDRTALPPCHWSFECLPVPLNLSERIGLIADQAEREDLAKLWQENEMDIIKNRLDNMGVALYQFGIKWHQRSVDMFLGLPFNIASYAFLGKILQEFTGYPFTSLIGDLSNLHIYEPHEEAMKELQMRNPDHYPAPKFRFSNRARGVFNKFRKKEYTVSDVLNLLDIKDFEVLGYQSFDAIPAEMIAPIVATQE